MLEDPQQLEKAIQTCAEMIELYVPGLKSLMKKPDAISDIDAVVMKEILTYQNGNLRIPNVYAYVRERYGEESLGVMSAEPLRSTS